MLSVIAMTGCAAQQQQAELRRADEQILRKQLVSAKEKSIVNCLDKRQCDKALSLTKVYITQNSDMKVQTSDDTLISTYNSSDYARIALSAIKIPGHGDSSSIDLSASCKGLDGGSSFFSMCASRIVQIYEGFKPYVESRIN